jgi:hypothetical protein
VQADNAKQDEGAYIGNKPRQRGDAFVGKAGQRRVNAGVIFLVRLHQVPKPPLSTGPVPGSNVVLTAFLA